MAMRHGRGRAGRSSGTASGILFLVAFVVVLALTFTLGMLVGRQWARRTAVLPAGAIHAAGDPGATPADGSAPDAGEGRERPRVRRLSEREHDDAAPQIQEKLTFYRTLTAPLTAAPPPAGKRPPTETAKPAVGPSRPGAEREQVSEAVARSEATAGTLYTVQVAAFRSRAQAEKLREELGQEAYVSEAGPATPARYRVRIGSFSGRPEAEMAAARLRSEHALDGFVTPKPPGLVR